MFDRILEDFEKTPIKMPALPKAKASDSIIPNPTPATFLARKKANSKTPVFETQDNPFLDAFVVNHSKAVRPEENDVSPVAKRKRMSQQLTNGEPARKTTRWADLEERLIDITYRVPGPGATAQSAAYEYNRQPPKAKELIDSLVLYGLPSKIYRVPYYSNEEDVPEQPMRYAGRVYHIKGGTGVGSLEHWGSNEETPADHLPIGLGINGWEYAGVPPSSRMVKQWLDNAPSQDAVRKVPDPQRSQVRVYAAY
jgi:hypothetical protein